MLVPTSGTLGLTDRAFRRTTVRRFCVDAGTTASDTSAPPGYQSLIGTDVNAQMQSNNSVYIRIEFDLPNPVPAFDRLELRMKYDDGFLVFLNGSIAASRNSPASPQWNSNATAPHEAIPSAFDILDLTSRRSDLRPGRNILAIQGFNVNVTDDDMTLCPSSTEAFWSRCPARAPINFGAIVFSRFRGIRIRNTSAAQSNTIAVDISIADTGEFSTISGGTVLPPNGTRYLAPIWRHSRADSSPKGGEGRSSRVL